MAALAGSPSVETMSECLRPFTTLNATRAPPLRPIHFYASRCADFHNKPRMFIFYFQHPRFFSPSLSALKPLRHPFDLRLSRATSSPKHILQKPNKVRTLSQFLTLCGQRCVFLSGLRTSFPFFADSRNHFVFQYQVEDTIKNLKPLSSIKSRNPTQNPQEKFLQTHSLWWLMPVQFC